MRPVQSRCGWAFSSVGRPWVAPASVADAVCALEWMLQEHFFQVLQLARSPANLKDGAGGAAHSDAGRVVAAVFEAP